MVDRTSAWISFIRPMIHMIFPLPLFVALRNLTIIYLPPWLFAVYFPIFLIKSDWWLFSITNYWFLSFGWCPSGCLLLFSTQVQITTNWSLTMTCLGLLYVWSSDPRCCFTLYLLLVILGCCFLHSGLFLVHWLPILWCLFRLILIHVLIVQTVI